MSRLLFFPTRFANALSSLVRRKVLDTSKVDDVLIKSRGGDTFAVVPKKREVSPFDVPGVKTEAKTSDILRAVRESRSRES